MSIRDEFTKNAEEFDALVVRMLSENEELKEKYNELIYAVSRKCPSESRHETALRYIHTMETPSDTGAKSAG